MKSKTSCSFTADDDVKTSGTCLNKTAAEDQSCCIYFNSCFFLHGTPVTLRKFAKLILDELPPEPQVQVVEPLETEVTETFKENN